MDNDSRDLHDSIGEATDRISGLPDSLIHNILSFLDIKHVARTCVLSKRWMHIWISIPILDFQFWEVDDPTSLSEINKFMNFVDRTFLLHDASSIQKFTLDLYENMDASRVHSWIEHVTKRNVQELSLYIDLDQDIPLSIPLSLFTCESLTKLELTAAPSMHFPKNIYFPKLNSLTLSRIQFGDGCWSEQPFSNCPVLEKLVLDSCTWFGMRKFCILNLVLKIFEITNDFEEREGLEDCDLKIHAPNLLSLTYCGCVAKDYDLSSFLTLDTASVEFFFFDNQSRRLEQRMNVSKFLQAVSHVRHLSLYVQTEQASVADCFLSNLPKFYNLNELKLHHGATVGKRIFAMLKAAPNLKCLVLSELEDSSSDEEKEYVETEDLFRHLQVVRFVGFRGRRRESRLAKLILKYAKSLLTMTIAFSSDFSDEKNKELVISGFPNIPRASERCVVKFA